MGTTKEWELSRRSNANFRTGLSGNKPPLRSANETMAKNGIKKKGKPIPKLNIGDYSPKDLDLYYRGLQPDISTEQYDIIISKENDYFDC